MSTVLCCSVRCPRGLIPLLIKFGPFLYPCSEVWIIFVRFEFDPYSIFQKTHVSYGVIVAISKNVIFKTGTVMKFIDKIPQPFGHDELKGFDTVAILTAETNWRTLSLGSLSDAACATLVRDSQATWAMAMAHFAAGSATSTLLGQTAALRSTKSTKSCRAW